MEAVEEGTFGSWTGEELKELNEKLYEDIRGDRYETSYGNPAWAVSRLGKELGRLLCFLYAEIRGDIAYAFEGRMLEMVIGNEALIEIYNLFEEGVPTEREVKDVLYWCVSDYCDVTLTYRIRECPGPVPGLCKEDHHGKRSF